MSELTEIQSFYKGKTIFITGGTGLMGKVLIEKLLYSCSELNKIYVLIRSKRGRTPDIRVDDMFKLPMFERVRKTKPYILKKVVPLAGDVNTENLGLSNEQLQTLIEETDILFHCAATLRLEAKLKDAIEMNTIGTKRMLELAKKMKHLKAFVHLSTAFCYPDLEELGERVYDAPDDPHDIMRLMQWLDEAAIDLITPKLLDLHPNTYTYSKRLAEKLVADEYSNLACCIARPSIVTPAWAEPLPGWVDNLNGPVGLMVGAGKGVIRSMHCKANYHAEVIPVDLAINALISISYRIATASEKSKNIPVFNITQSGVMPITWGEVLEKGKKIAYENPFEGQIWYPDGDIRSSKFVHNLFVFFFHIIPAYFIDFLLLIFQQKRFMVRLQKRISVGLEVLQYFTTREWVFHNTNLLIMWGEMSKGDKEIFPIDLQAIDDMAYIKICILGARQFCMKENLSSLPKARRHQTIMYIVHIIAVYLFYFGVLYLIYKNFEIARFCVHSVADSVAALPILNGGVRKIQQ
ncbi:putative fatty acyl-CoA reductase CG5065 isoform X2 [Nomia melanderi]|nr:putative fatty acyl-CoA reductase CG5065 isoform X2 [Nomia melanderi]XP_031848959.1 putative fatty acyl-CoA reductase CG5065 isoform X2 [Nomia melanderi]XP_031848963.1 putative fatty acyl-CoA reductase CG5065 isoform X2 [Nomia melanderi]XP_031848966.1 putative fatty acyl-CoA reductase CG5065 isoform X2 [Nomia melanderi]XP_031848970.1 putative fatty acyl-CoA reductase CG5065 isoform X2 [Nomia melanderi]XP_031848975.1 putative fatty acyl-CoA reductase CG5065 isoform X2 [Nomia melanderi]